MVEWWLGDVPWQALTADGLARVDWRKPSAVALIVGITREGSNKHDTLLWKDEMQLQCAMVTLLLQLALELIVSWHCLNAVIFSSSFFLSPSGGHVLSFQALTGAVVLGPPGRLDGPRNGVPGPLGRCFRRAAALIC